MPVSIQDKQTKYLLRGGNVVDVVAGKVLPNHNVWMADGRIVDVQPNKEEELNDAIVSFLDGVFGAR